VKVSRLSVELYAIFANDGRAVKPLEKTSFDKASQNGEITTKWKKYQGVRLRIVRLKQVARPETLSTNPRQPSTSRSQQSEAATDDDAPSDGSPVQLDNIQVSQRSKKRTSSLSKSGQAQQQKLSRLPVTGRRPHSNEDDLDSHSTDDDETGSEMVLQVLRLFTTRLNAAFLIESRIHYIMVFSNPSQVASTHSPYNNTVTLVSS
jgi:hypothetical protein